jgi:hypothetical protein
MIFFNYHFEMGNHSNLSSESKLSSNCEQGAQGEAAFGIDQGPQHFCTIHAAPMVSTLQHHLNCQSVGDKPFSQTWPLGFDCS